LVFIASAIAWEQIEGLVKSLKEKKSLTDMLRPLRDAEAFIAVARHLCECWQNVCDEKWLYEQLTNTHADPIGYAKSLGVSAKYVRPGVVCEALVELLKAATKKKQAFGITRLIALLDAQLEEKSRFERLANSVGAGPASWRSANTVSYGYRDWVFGADRKNFTLPRFELLRVASAFSLAARSIKEGTPVAALEGLRHFWVSNLFESKFSCHRDLDVLDRLLLQALERAELPVHRVPFFPTIWAEVARSKGMNLNVRSGSAAVFRVSKSTIVTRSASEEGRDHKKKELCGRALAHRFELDADTRIVRRREGTEKMLLVVDGTWNSSDLATLISAGWDEVFYPDEMDKLVKAII
jgi:hypothetical protein